MRSVNYVLLSTAFGVAVYLAVVGDFDEKETAAPSRFQSVAVIA